MQELIKPPSGIVCLPVEWVDSNPKPAVEDMHVTIGYIPDMTQHSVNAILDALNDKNSIIMQEYTTKFHVLNVLEPAAFGENKDVPVLRVASSGTHHSLENLYNKVWTDLWRGGIEIDKTFGFNAHVTVDLKTVLDPPEQLVARPLEFWTRDGDKVAA